MVEHNTHCNESISNRALLIMAISLSAWREGAR